MAQKTWTDLLGPWDDACEVDGRYIVRRSGRHCFVLWSFPSYGVAKQCLDAWRAER